MLLPPFSVPGHASYPSGHATQARLIAKCAHLAMKNDPRSDKERVRIQLKGLAKRIARNREIAGFHYRSDSEKGAELANKIFAFIETDRLSGSPKIKGYKDAVAAAQGEWT
jgi:hypothetical protein